MAHPSKIHTYLEDDVFGKEWYKEMYYPIAIRSDFAIPIGPKNLDEDFFKRLMATLMRYNVETKTPRTFYIDSKRKEIVIHFVKESK